MESASNRRARVLGQRNFQLLLASKTISLIGDWMTPTALAFAVIAVDGSATDVGVVFAASSVALVSTLLLGGAMADRISRKRLMVRADWTRFFVQGFAAVLMLSGQATVETLALLAAVNGGATGFFGPAASGILPSVVFGEDLQAANGISASAQGVGEIAGPLIGGLLVVAGGSGWALAIDAMTFAVSAVLLSRITEARVPADDPGGGSYLQDIRAGWRLFTSRGWVWRFVLSISAATLVGQAWLVLGPLVAEQELGGAGPWGLAQSAIGLGGIVGGVVAVRLLVRRPLVQAALAFAVFALPLGLMGAGVPLPLLLAGCLLAGTGVMLSNALWMSTLQTRIPTDELSRISAYEWLGSVALVPVGLIVWGPVSDLIGIHEALLVAFALQVVATLAPIANREVREVGRGSPARVADEVSPRLG